MPTMSRIEQAFCRSAPWRAFAKRSVLPWALADEALSGDVLEIGSGSGAMAAAVLERFPDVRLIATDADPAMVDAATSRLARYGDRVEIRQVDSTSLEFDDDCFDAVLSFLMLHHVMRWERALVEAIRVLRPGGVLVGYDLLETPPARFIHGVDGSAHRLFRLPELRAAVADLPVEVPDLASCFGGIVTQFRLRKVK
ncbi:MAG: class I SAM-dependent methyltransferase [Acidimicrobiia bacterium]|nr:class I SAM-dependent methyltransferase [Acidimicrobiia bacterium]